MHPQRWEQIEQLFEAARQQPADHRAEFLRQSCPDEPELCAEVLTLLKAADTGDSFLDGAALASTSEHPVLKAGEKVDSFEILALIAKGGMGEVYRARDLRLQRDVALKVLPAAFARDSDRLRRFEHEARAASLLNHPNILAIYEIGAHAGAPFIVSELLEGETLQACLAAGPVPVRKALDYACQAANGLAAAHQKGIVHRDLKPANLFLTGDGRIKILDFGLAKPAQASTGAEAEGTEPGLVLGTAGYMSPEQVRGQPADSRSDIFSFGAVLYELLTGQRAFRGESAADTMSAILGEDPTEASQLNPKLSSGVSRVVRRCLEKRPEQRFESARDLAFALETLGEPESLDSREGEAALEGFRAASPPARLRSRAGWFAAAAVAALCIVSLAIFRFREPTFPRQRLEFQMTPVPRSTRDFQLSPDGRFIAFATQSGSNMGKLWIRALDSLETRLADNGFVWQTLFWSPDGQFVAARRGDKLCKIPRRGGVPVVLADAPKPYSGGAWLDSGDIVIAVEDEILRVRSSGGAPVRTGVQEAAWPAALPGGRFLFNRRIGGSENGTYSGIFAGSLDGRPPVRILSDGIEPIYVPPAAPGGPGELLFLRDEVMWAQPFDANRLALRGDAVAIVPHVGRLPDRRAITASATGILVYKPADSVNSATLAWLDRSGRKLETLSRPFAIAVNPAIRLSPDETKAIVPVAGPEETDLWIADLSRKTFSQLTFRGSNSGIWSPDGKKVLWAANDGNRYLRAADGSGTDELLFKNPHCDTCFPTDWSSDGKLIAFGEFAAEEDPLELWLLSVTGSRQMKPYVKTGHGVAWGQISPNSHWMAYVGFPAGGLSQVIVETIPGRTKSWQISTAGGDWPVWRRDGKELFYSWDNTLMSVPINENGGLVDFGVPQKLFEFQGAADRYQVSRDGKRFLIAVPAADSFDRTPLIVDTDWRARLTK